MIKGIDPDYFKIITASHSISVIVKIFKGDVDTDNVLRVEDGKISADKGQRARRSIGLHVALNAWEDLPARCDLVSHPSLSGGLQRHSRSSACRCGTFRVDSLGSDRQGCDHHLRHQPGGVRDR